MEGSTRLGSKPKSLVSKAKEKVKGAVKEAVHGTRVEINLNRLSRKVLARLARLSGKKRREQLRRLQEKLQGLEGWQKDELMEKVRAKTKRELAAYKTQMAEAERDKRVEDFMLELNEVFVQPEDDALEKLAAKTAVKVEQEELFYSTLNKYVGKESNKKFLKHFMKTPLVQKLLSGLKTLDEDAAKRINMAVEQGDYKKLREILVDASDGELSPEHIDKVFGSAPYFKDVGKPVTGYKLIDWVINTAKSWQYLGHGYVMHEAGKHAEIPFFIIMQTANMTLNRLRQIDTTFQQNKDFIISKQKQTLHDQKRLGFIDAIHKLRESLDAQIMKPGRDGKTLEEKFRDQLDYYMEGLRKDKKIDVEGLKYINAYASLENLRLQQVYELAYGRDEKRDRVVTRIFSRIPTAVRFYRRAIANPELAKTLQKYHWERLKTRTARRFKKASKGWGLEDIRGKGDELYRQVENFNSSRGSEVGKQAESIKGDVLKEHDDILKKYYTLVNRTSKVLTANAQKVLEAGGALEKFRQGYDLSKEIDWAHSPHLSNDTLETLFPGQKASAIRGKSMTGNKLLRAYTERLVELRTMQDTTRAYFSGMARDIEAKVANPVTQQWGEKMERLGRRESEKLMHEKLDTITTQTSPWKKKLRLGGKLILPGILLGLETKALLSGKAKPREFMWNAIEMAGGFVPVVGTILDFKAAFTGRSLAGRKLSLKEQFVSGIFGVVGLVADALTVVGGVGLGLREGLGFLRGGRRAIKAGTTMRAMHEAGMAKKGQPILSRIGMWFGGKFNKAARLESATASHIAANAYDQARLMSKHGIRDLAHAEKELSALRPYMDATKKAELTQLIGLMKKSRGFEHGYDYIDALRKLPKMGLKDPSKIWMLHRGWLWIKSHFHKYKAALMGLGVDAKVIKKYEETFEKIRELEAARAKAVTELGDLAKSGRYFEKGETAGKMGAKASQVEKAEDLIKEQRTLAQARKSSLKAGDAARRKYKGIPEMEDLFDKAREGGKITKAEIANAVKAARKRKRFKSLSHKEITDALGHYKDARDSLDKLKKIKQQGQTEFKEAVQAGQATRQIARKKKEIAGINKDLAALHNDRFVMQTEIMYKAENAMDTANKLRHAVRFLQYGIVAGGLAFLTSMAPDKAVEGGYKVIKGTAVATYKVGKKVFWDEHGGKPPVDEMIEKRLKRGKLKYQAKKIKQKVIGGASHRPSPDALRDDTGQQAKHD